jgi:hypothetical protein
MTYVETGKDIADAMLNVDDCDAYVMVKHTVQKDGIGSLVLYATTGAISDEQTMVYALFPIARGVLAMLDKKNCPCDRCNKSRRLCESVIAVIEREDLPEGTKLS